MHQHIITQLVANTPDDLKSVPRARDKVNADTRDALVQKQY